MLCNLTSSIGRIAKSRQRQPILNLLQAAYRSIIGVGQNRKVLFSQDVMPFQSFHFGTWVGRNRRIRLFDTQRMLVVAALPGMECYVLDGEFVLRQGDQGWGQGCRN